MDYRDKFVKSIPYDKLTMLETVLEKHLNARPLKCNLYVLVSKWAWITDPALDAAVVASLLSSRHNQPIDPDTVVFGEVGLTGEPQAVNFTRERLAEAARLGFQRTVIPVDNHPEQVQVPGIEVIGVETVAELESCLLPSE